MNSDKPDHIKAEILVVDDTAENLHLLSLMLSKEGYSVRKALNGEIALKSIEAVPPDLILLDIMMRGMDGFEVCQRLKADEQTARIPIIFLSALSEGFDKAKAFSSGGADYITKPYQFVEVLARVRNQLAIREAELKIMHLNNQLEQRVEERTHQLETANQELQRKIAERQQLQAELLKMALYDPLTELPNRALLMERLEQTLVMVKENRDYQFAVMFLDCDRFKVINDSLGHLVGDQLLVAIARRLETCLPSNATLSRLGGDEFTILLSEADDHNVVQTADQVLQAFNQGFRIERHEVFINASIGIVLGHSGYNQPEHLLRDADAAMYQAKASGKAQYQIFDPSMHEAALQALQIETDLRRAIKQQELVAHYQPIINLETGKIAGFEALVRWQHPERGLIMPNDFISIAEETGLIGEIGTWMLREACQQLRWWQTEELGDRQLTISVNLSAHQFAHPKLVDQIVQILEETQLNPQCLKLEITESAIMDNAPLAADILRKLRKHHIQLSIDDFGTGYSSLSYLHSFPVDALKIDRSFIWRMNQHPEGSGLVPLIINIAHAMDMEVTAEGIETTEQLNQLRALHCNYGQGYLFSKPVEAAKATQLIASTLQW